MRTRSCTNPAPAYGGDICLGLHTEEALCSTQPCPGEWRPASCAARLWDKLSSFLGLEIMRLMMPCHN